MDTTTERVFEGVYSPSFYGMPMEVGDEDVENFLTPYWGKLVRLTVKVELLKETPQ